MANFSYKFVHLVQPAGTDVTQTGWNTARWQPRVDISHSRDTILIQVEVPGLAEDKLQLHYETGALIVSGTRSRPLLPEHSRCLQVEIEYGSFQRVLPLPVEADGENISAHYDAGILTITVPIKKAAERVQVNIR